MGYGPNHDLPLLTAEDLDKMTPADRREAFRARTITSWSDLPADVAEHFHSDCPPPSHR